MDTITHSIYGGVCGLILARKNQHVSPLKSATVGAFAGFFPDIDFLFNLISSDFYLKNHRGLTHSLWLLPFFSFLLSLFWCSLWKNSITIGNPISYKKDNNISFFKLMSKIFDKNLNFSLLKFFWIISLFGIITHILMDVITSFGTMFLWPIKDTRYEFASIFIIDLYLSSFALFALIGATFMSLKNKQIIAILGYLFGLSYIGFAYYNKFEAQKYMNQYLSEQNIKTEYIVALPGPGSVYNWSVIAKEENSEVFFKTNINLFKNEKDYKQIINTNGIFDLIHNEYIPKNNLKLEKHLMFGDNQIKEKAKELFEHPDAFFAKWFLNYPVLDNFYKKDDYYCVDFKDLRFVTKVRQNIPFIFSICSISNNKVILTRKS